MSFFNNLFNSFSFNSSPSPTGFKSGKGTATNPFNIDEVTVTASKGGSISNYIQKGIDAVNSAANLIGSIKGNKTTNSQINSPVGEILTSEGIVFKGGLNNDTKKFIALGGVALLVGIYLLTKK